MAPNQASRPRSAPLRKKQPEPRPAADGHGAEVRIERVHGPARRAILKGLIAFNAEVVGAAGRAPLTLTLRAGGKVIGGLSAETYYGWMFVAHLWVDEKYRRNGGGRSLLTTAESEARARGVRHVFLDTFSFQAPTFYKKLGYRQFARLDDFPEGHSRFWLTKTL